MRLFGFSGAVVAALFVGGDFSDVAKMWKGNAYGGGPGRVSRIVEGTNAFARLEKTRGPGATQLIGRDVLPIGATRTFELSFRHRGAGGSCTWRLMRPNPEGRYEHVLNSAGRAFDDFLSFEASADWKSYVRTFTVPARLVHPANAISVKFDVWGGNEPRTLDIDDVAARAVEAPEDAPPSPPVAFTVKVAPKDEGFTPVPRLSRANAEIRDGLLLRDGKPFFWVGEGDGYGASQSGAVGLWGAKLLGNTVVSLDPTTSLQLKEEGPGRATFTADANLTGVSHFREAARLGFFVDWFWNGVFKYSPFRKYAAAHPELGEAHYRHGHYLQWDTGTGLGLEVETKKREAFFRYVADTGDTEVELCREPGPEPSNARARRGFREWARRKYGTLENACQTWRRTYATWDDVLPMHLEESDVNGYMARILQGRQAKADFPEIHYDWLAYVQDDTTACVRRQREALRRPFPDLPVTIDVRGHGSEADGYCALDPERIDPLVDLFSIHFGAHVFAYNNTPYHLPSLLDQTSFALFSYNFFRTNTEKPIFNSEDIVSVACVPKSDAAVMAENDLGQLHASPWKFRLEGEGEDGLAAGWWKPGLDDSAWDEMSVPGCWDETERYKCRPGVAWYRKRFVANARRLDWEDGSHRFYIYGKGVAQSGTVWLNGEKVGEVSGWDANYKFDVSPVLRYGGENELVFRVAGSGYQNGLRFFCHVLSSDCISKAVRFGESQYRIMLWPYLMHGTVGCWVWSWHDDRTRPYYPSMIKKLEVASEVVLPDLRRRRGTVAYLYGFLSGRGLPCTIVGNHEPYLNWYNAIEFSGVRPDVFGERHFRKEICSGRYKLLVVPHTKYVHDATYAAFKRYVKEGGTAVVTDGTFLKTFDRWVETDIRDFARMDAAKGAKPVVTRRGRGRVVYVPGEPTMEALQTILKPYLPKPEVAVASAETREPPLIERVLAGSETRKVLYLGNWGGLAHDLTVTVPAGLESWRMTKLVGDFSRDGDGRLRVRVPSQDVAVVLLEAPSVTECVNTGVSPAWQAAVERNAALNVERDTGRPKVLFPKFKGAVNPLGKELYPYILDRIDAFGCESKSVPLEEWTPELLASCPLVVLTETNTQRFYRQSSDKMQAFCDLLERYVEDGGSLMFLVNTAWEVNNYGWLLERVTPRFGIGKGRGVRSTRHAGFGDPGQVLGEAEGTSPLAVGVGRVQLYRMTSLKFLKGSAAKAAVRIPSDAESGVGEPAVATVEKGRGRVFISPDVMLFQPFRVGTADNAAFLVNTLGWLLRRPVTDEMRAAFRDDLFIDKIGGRK